jgi:predicted ester cyclase
MSLTKDATDRLALDHLTAMATGDAELARRCLDPGHVNRMATEEPPACAQPGVPGFLATSAWLRLAFAELRFDLLRLVSEGDTTVAHVRMSGRQTGPFVVFPDGAAPVAFPPTGREFSVQQCHLFTVRDGLHAEHVAVREDLGMMTQLGHLPPSPAAGLRMLRWHLSGGARRAVREAVDAAAAAATAEGSRLSGSDRRSHHE